MMSSTEPGLYPRILRIPRSDVPESYVLAHITRIRSTPLDLNITATEGENPYTGTVRQSSLKGLRAKNYQGDDEEWVQIVSHVFGQLEESAEKVGSLYGIESSASIIDANDDDDKELVITIRKRVQNITQRLGSVTLKQNDQQAIQLFDWSGIIAVRAKTLEQRFTSLLAHYRSAEDTIKQLNKQLEEFVSARVQHEEELIVNFVQILNQKKLKIRNQQRLLSSAKVDHVKVSEIQDATSDQHLRLSRNNRASKRTAGEMTDDESESEDGFEKMELDKAVGFSNTEEGNETDDSQTSTPQPLEAGDSAIDEGSLVPSVPASSGDEWHKLEHRRPTNRPVMKEPVPPPPRRELPFTRKAQTAVEEQKAQTLRQRDTAEQTGGETDDDEL
ncbi:hypothetical protein ETB97_004147 [Aspergillus alliaceus]|uniref:DNA repair protein XRCC4 n=1 Tax=Petromyces alliaceus TaxID=209559 RepID=A0A8H6EC72_PETAA|nr:hypothetical protein ETB97_004147 [Aspergillus burnettii]